MLLAVALVTFSHDVAPILYKHCVACHRPGEVAPFPLISYRDAAKRAGLIATVAEKRYMPPWLPVHGYGSFAGERRLTGVEIATLRKWADAGAPPGNPADLPPPPRFPDGWQLGKPDLVLSVAHPFSIPAEGPDLYRCFVLPAPSPSDRYIRAIEFRPGERKVVHHAIFFQDTSGTARARDKGEGYDCFGAPGFLPVRGLGGWTPGGFPIRLPADMAEVLYRGADVVVQIHYHPTGKPERDQSEMGLYFTTRKPERHPMDIALGSTDIDIPPGDRAYTVRDHFTLPVDVEALGIIPHAHYVCRDMKGIAVLPDGTRRWLIWIRDWNFDWQGQYRYAPPVKLPAGTRLEMEFTYDNSDDNPRNPHQPPQRIHWGLGSGDEMAGLHVQVVPADPDDAEELGQALWGKMMRALGGGIYRKR